MFLTFSLTDQPTAVALIATDVANGGLRVNLVYSRASGPSPPFYPQMSTTKCFLLSLLPEGLVDNISTTVELLTSLTAALLFLAHWGTAPFPRQSSGGKTNA